MSPGTLNYGVPASLKHLLKRQGLDEGLAQRVLYNYQTRVARVFHGADGHWTNGLQPISAARAAKSRLPAEFSCAVCSVVHKEEEQERKKQDKDSYKNFGHKLLWLEINIGQILMMRWFLESGQRDLSNGDIGFRVWHLILEIGFGNLVLIGFRIGD